MYILLRLEWHAKEPFSSISTVIFGWFQNPYGCCDKDNSTDWLSVRRGVAFRRRLLYAEPFAIRFVYHLWADEVPGCFGLVEVTLFPLFAMHWRNRRRFLLGTTTMRRCGSSLCFVHTSYNQRKSFPLSTQRRSIRLLLCGNVSW